MFNLNDKVFCPGHGVAIIDEINEKMIADKSIQVLRLAFIYKDMTIWIPLSTVVQSGIRYLSSPEEVEDAMAELFRMPERKFESIDFTPSGWNRRNKQYQALIQGGSLKNLMKIYRDLMHISRQKELSFGEKSLLTMLEDLISQELIITSKTEKEVVLQSLRSPFLQGDMFNTSDQQSQMES